MKLTHIRLMVGDFAASFRFYSNVMGLKSTWGDETSGYADFDSGGDCALAIFQRGALAENVGVQSLEAAGVPQEEDRAMLIFGVDDLRAEVEGLRSRGATIEVEPHDRPDWGISLAYLRDPDGNLIEVNTPISHEGWSDELKAESEKYKQQSGGAD